MHSRTGTALETLRGVPSIRLEAVVGEYHIQPDQQHGKGKKTVFSISINIYGSEKVIQDVGKRLSKAHAYLQHPIHLNNSIPYNNPHYYTIPDVRKEKYLYVSPASGIEDKQGPVLDLAKIFEEVDRSRILPSQNADWHIMTPLLRYGCISNRMIVADSMSFAHRHQKEALHFIIQRECMIIDDVSSLWKAQHKDDGSY